jgi:CDP-glucose 4,6-dehydratase
MSKGAAELMISSYRRSFFLERGDRQSNVAVGSARAGNVIGGGDWAPDRIVPDCIRALQSGKPISVRRPDAVRPWQHVLEPLSGYLTLGRMLLSAKSAERTKASEAWNFGPDDENSSSVRELVESIIAVWGCGSWRDDSSSQDVHEATMLRLSIEKAEQLLDWHPRWDLSTTVARTVDWYRAFYSGENMREWCGRQIDEHSQGAS